MYLYTGDGPFIALCCPLVLQVFSRLMNSMDFAISNSLIDTLRPSMLAAKERSSYSMSTIDVSMLLFVLFKWNLGTLNPSFE